MGGTVSLMKNGKDQSFNIPAPKLTEENLPDQSGKVFLVTGANIGVGYNVADILYRHNAKVWLACRTKSKAEDAISAIKAAHPNSTGSLHFLSLDLSDLSTIKASADEFLSKESKLHWLDNNAGVMFPPKGSKAKQGHELQFGTNVLGPYLFTKLVLPLLKKTATTEPQGTVRVSWAGSAAVEGFSPKGGVLFKKDPTTGELIPEDFGGMQTAYGATKTANWFLAHEFGRRGTDGKGDGVLHNAYNPGNLKSNLTQHIDNRIGGTVLTWFMNLFLLYPAVYGAYTELYAGLSPDLNIETDQGGYIIPWGRKRNWTRPDVQNEVGAGKNSEKLWDWCERETKAYA